MSSKARIDKASIRAIPMEQFLAKMNVLPLRHDNHGYWYLSPLRSEKTPSFKVNPKLNTWFDFGSKQGGNIIDFVMVKWSKTFYDAMVFLNQNDCSKISIEQLLPSKKGNKIEKIIRVENEVKNYMLSDYLSTRGIDLKKVNKLVGEIYYKLETNPRTYYAIAFKNDIGGYDVRNKYFKGCIGEKYFTCIKRGFDSITVFEGFIDFLSLECYRPINSDILVLNSCVTTPKAIPTINKYDKSYLMLDNDKQGNNTTEMIFDYTNGAKDLRYLYEKHKDVNDWILSLKQ